MTSGGSDNDTAEARALILAAAERLIAEQGPTVALREIAVAAGQKNNSAVQYHFGDRDGLIAAVVESRLERVERGRMELLADLECSGRAEDAASLMDALTRPMFEMSPPGSSPPSFYARFLQQVRVHPSLREIGLDASRAPALRIIIARLSRMVDSPSAEVVARRIELLTATLFAALADRERHLAGATCDPERDASSRADIVRVLTAILTAPTHAGPTTQAARAGELVARSKTKRKE